MLEQLVLASSRPDRVRNLRALHELCKAQAKGSKDFSRGTIGRLCEAARLFKRRILYNAGSEPYRTLIDAWSAYAGAPSKSAHEEIRDVVRDKLGGIPDPALRSLVLAILSENNRLRAEVRLLKASTVMHIDRRSMALSLPGSETIELAAQATKLTPTEYDALRHVLSKTFLDDEGLTEGPHGELINRLGRVVFPVGFCKAIRRILDSENRS